jgi:hypothetical protein
MMGKSRRQTDFLAVENELLEILSDFQQKWYEP